MNELVRTFSLGPAEATLREGECTVATWVSRPVSPRMGGLHIGYLATINGLAKNAEGRWMRKLPRPERRMLVCGATSLLLVQIWGCRNVLPCYTVPPLVLNWVCRNDPTFCKSRVWTLCTYCALVCPCGLYVLTVPCVPGWEASGEVLVFYGNKLS